MLYSRVIVYKESKNGASFPIFERTVEGTAGFDEGHELRSRRTR